MTRQPFLLFLVYFWALFFVEFTTSNAYAKPPTDTTYVVPSPQEEKKIPPPETKVDPQQLGIDPSYVPEKEIPPPVYHLDPRPSFTFALSRGYEVSDDEHSGWLGLHIAPWMTATSRIQMGLDLHDDLGWLQLAIHSLPTRNLYRLYWGGGVSLVIDSKRELRPFIEIDSYHLFLTGGWEFQLIEYQNIRFEISYHQGVETSFGKATLGYTVHF